MWRFKSSRLIVSASLLVIFIGVTTCADAQGLSGPWPSVNGVFGRTWSALGGFFTQDLPGAADPSMPVIFPPYFGGEIYIRPAFFNITKATANSNQGDVIDILSGRYRVNGLFDSRGGMNDPAGSYIESMLRFQIGRLSLRGYYTAYLKQPNTSDFSVNWPTWRLGADIDIIYYRGLRIGATYDLYPERPFVQTFDTNIQYVKICAEVPQTVGFVASFTPCASCSISPSIEFRGQWPLGAVCSSCSSNGTQITQWEIAAGFVLPRTVIGQSGLRFGYRWMDLFTGCSDVVQEKRWAIDVNTSAYFGELVWFY